MSLLRHEDKPPAQSARGLSFSDKLSEIRACLIDL